MPCFVRCLCLISLLMLANPSMEMHKTKKQKKNAVDKVVHQHAGPNNVSSHVLDIAIGAPAKGVECTAYKLVKNAKGKVESDETEKDDIGTWESWGSTVTDTMGRIPIVHPDKPLSKGIYKLRFDTAKYFKAQKRPTFFPYIEVAFQIEDPDVHYHVPITLSCFGYSTYRGQ